MGGIFAELLRHWPCRTMGRRSFASPPLPARWFTSEGRSAANIVHMAYDQSRNEFVFSPVALDGGVHSSQRLAPRAITPSVWATIFVGHRARKASFISRYLSARLWQ